MFISSITSVPLNARPDYRAMIISGSPIASGRIVAMSDDKCTAHVIWHATQGTYSFSPDIRTIDVAYIIFGRLTVRQSGKDNQHLGPGSLIQFPCGPFELEIVEPFLKYSTLYNPNGLTLEVEPLPREGNAV